MHARILCFFLIVSAAFSAGADVYSILYEAGVPWLDPKFTVEDLNEQQKVHASALPGEEALKIALQILIHDNNTPKTPLAISGTKAKLMFALNQHHARLYLVSVGDEDHKPQWGEKVENNWIFCLYMPHVSDHLYWAVVDRKGIKNPYAYGFN